MKEAVDDIMVTLNEAASEVGLVGGMVESIAEAMGRVSSSKEFASFHLKWAFRMIPQRCWKCPCHWFSLVLQISFKSADVSCHLLCYFSDLAMWGIFHTHNRSFISAVTTSGILIECPRNLEEKEIGMMSEWYNINSSVWDRVYFFNNC